MSSICLLPRLSGLGGPASFSSRLIAALAARGVEVHHDPLRPGTRTVLVLGGTRRLDWLWQARQRGVRIVQRLDGFNWLQRRTNTGLRHFLKAEWGNWLLSTTRRYLAQHIIYQSEFTHQWWEATYGKIAAPHTVIHNGVDLAQFTPEGPHQRPTDHYRLLLVEARLSGGYELGLHTAVSLMQALQSAPGLRWELMVAGQVAPELRRQVEQTPGLCVTWTGVLRREEVPALDRSAHLLFSADLNAACPNAVIEALACGLPVIGYATGALPELLIPAAGLTPPYGSDYWQLQPPVIAPLAKAAQTLITQGESARTAARSHAVANFDIQMVVNKYLAVLE